MVHVFNLCNSLYTVTVLILVEFKVLWPFTSCEAFQVTAYHFSYLIQKKNPLEEMYLLLLSGTCCLVLSIDLLSNYRITGIFCGCLIFAEFCGSIEIAEIKNRKIFHWTNLVTMMKSCPKWLFSRVYSDACPVLLLNYLYKKMYNII